LSLLHIQWRGRVSDKCLMNVKRAPGFLTASSLRQRSDHREVLPISAVAPGRPSLDPISTPPHGSKESQSFTSHRGWLATVLAGSVATVGYFLIPNAVVQASVFPLFAVSCGVLILVAAKSISVGRTAWRCFAIGLLLWGAGDTVWALYGLAGKVAPYPSIADILYLIGYLPLIAGVVIYVTSRRRGSLLRSAMDMALIAIPVGLILWELVVLPYVQSAKLSSNDLVGLSYPLLDLILFGVAFTLIVSPRKRADAHVLGIAIALLLLADTLYGKDLLAGTYHTGIWYDGAWLISFVLWAGAALHPSTKRMPEKVREAEDDDTHTKLAFTAVVALVAIFAYDAFRGEGITGPEFVIGGGFTMLLAIARMHMEVRGSRRSQARVRDLMEHASDAIFVVDGGRYVEVNRAACSMTGYSRDELLTMEVGALTPSDQEDSVGDGFPSGAADETVISERKLVRKDGSVLTIESSAHQLPDGRFQSIARDISTRVEAERVQREGEELLRHAFDAGASGMALGTLDGEFIRVNQAFANMLGCEPKDLVGVEAAAITHPDDREAMVKPLSQMASGALSEFRTEKRFLHRDGHDICVRLDLALSCDGEGQPRLVVGHILDISHSKELEGRLRQAEKMEAVGQLAGGVAHDFNNILAVIMNYAEFVGETLGENHEGHSDLTQIVKAGERGAELVHQLLAFSRQEVIQPSAIDLTEVINGMAVLLERSVGEDISLTIDNEADLSLTMADRSQLERILLNLVVNARDSMPAEGRIAIETSNVILESGMRAGLSAGHYVRLAVTDTGTGIEARMLEHIFEPFFTTKPRGEGTGLGLATVYGIVKRSQGGIYADSEIGVGTSFTIYLPVTNEEVPAPAGPTEIEAGSHAATILVVEDEDPVRELIARILGREGFHVIDVTSGAEGFDTCASFDGKIDLLLTDVIMPQMSGPQLRDLVQGMRPDMRVLFMSGYTDELIAQRGVLAAGDSLLSKPFTFQQLLTRVRAALNLEDRAAKLVLERSR
jgi:two-component system cell cycle sensor histidine kinase/response regulator CckA